MSLLYNCKELCDLAYIYLNDILIKVVISLVPPQESWTGDDQTFANYFAKGGYHELSRQDVKLC